MAINLKQFIKAILERALAVELSQHAGYEKHAAEGRNGGNSRNGSTKKTLKGDFGEMELETPRDREGSFEPQIVAKRQTRFTGFDDKILWMYARGMRRWWKRSRPGKAVGWMRCTRSCIWTR